MFFFYSILSYWFPSSYKLPNLSDASLYKLAGNAISVPVVNLIANRIIPLLQEE